MRINSMLPCNKDWFWRYLGQNLSPVDDRLHLREITSGYSPPRAYANVHYWRTADIPAAGHVRFRQALRLNLPVFFISFSFLRSF
jgi:hypothetical protein